MKPLVRTARDERGVALPLALFALVMLTGLLLAFLTMAGMEPEMAANLSDVARARYVADAAIEFAYDQLVTNTNWNNVLLGPDLVANTADDGRLALNQTLPAPLNNASFGTFTVTVRNDDQNGDAALTGLAACNAGGASDCGPTLPTKTNDNNGAVVVTATGTYRGITRQIQVVLRRVTLPPFAGAFNMPGVQTDLMFSNANFNIDGRDYVYSCTANCSDPNPLNRTYTYSPKADQSKMKYGIATSVGTQANDPSFTLEQRAEYTLDTPPKRGNVMGKSQVGGGFTTGLNTVAADNALGSFVTLADPADTKENSQKTPQKMNDFLNQLAQFQSTQIYQSKLSCAQNISGVPVGIRMIANSDATKANLVTINDGCGLNKQIDLGTVDKPQLVYFRGDLDNTSAFAGVRTEQGSSGQQQIKGAGILIVEDGDFRVTNQLDWDGLVIVTGRYVTVVFESGAKVNVYGATVSNETKSYEGCSGSPCTETDASTLWDGVFQSSNITTLRYSQQNMDLVQRKLLFRMSTWREI